MKPGLFIAVGYFPALGDHAPPLLLLAGRWFDMVITPALLKTRRNARLVVSPWSNHLLAAWDSVLVNASVEAACAAVHKTPPASPTAWRWRLVGVVLAVLGAGMLAHILPELFPLLARVRGLLVAIFLIVSFALTIGYAWFDAAPHLRFFPKQWAAMAVTLLLAMAADRLRISRWSFAALGILAMVVGFCWRKATGSGVAVLFTIFTFDLTPALIAGTVAGWIAARSGFRRQGDIAMAIIVGCAVFQWFELPRKAPEVPKPHIAIKLDAKLLDACVGDYEFPPDNYFSVTGLKLTISRQGDGLRGRTSMMGKKRAAFDILPESETNFFAVIPLSDIVRTPKILIENSPLQFIFAGNDQGETTAVILHLNQGVPDDEGKKLKNE
jgi:hypothetical protein